MADRVAGRKVKLAERGLHPRRRGSRIDGDDAVTGGDEGEVAEIEALGHLNIWLGPPDPGRGEMKAVLGGDPVAAELQLGAGGEGAEPGPSGCLGGEVVFPQNGVGGGEGVVHGPQQGQRELVANRQHELQVRQRSLGPPRVGRKGGEGEPAEVLWQAEVRVSCLVQLGHRRLHVTAEAGLEEPDQREQQHLIGMGVGFLLEVGVSVRVRAGRSEPGGEGDDGCLVRTGPAGGRLQRFEVTAGLVPPHRGAASLGRHLGSLPRRPTGRVHP